MGGKGASEPKAAEASGEPDVNTLAAEYFRTFEPTSLVQRFIRVEEIAAVVGLLASPAGAAINGHAQRVEGGIIRSI
jgi:NAD(P)-dependent dehydrogenase (short-subunit alcohol dehydrogenase family)